jgi:hypothetical protein
VTTTRVATLLWHLAQGRELTNAEAGDLCGITSEGARMMLCRISEVWPIYNLRRGSRDIWIVLRPE